MLGAYRSLWSKKTHSAEKRQETHCVSNKEKEKWIGDDVEGETTVARKWVQDAETAIMQKLEDITTAENVEEKTGKPKSTFEDI